MSAIVADSPVTKTRKPRRLREEWRPIPGLDGLYEVSDHGRVRRLTNRNGYRSEPLVEPVIVTPKKTGKYLGVTLARDGWKKRFYLFHLVLLAFVGPRPDNATGSHLDGQRDNNCATNLTWEAMSNNHLRKRGHGTMICGEKMHTAKLRTEQVREIRRRKDENHRLLAAEYGVSRSLISMVQRRVIWAHVE